MNRKFNFRVWWLSQFRVLLIRLFVNSEAKMRKATGVQPLYNMRLLGASLQAMMCIGHSVSGVGVGDYIAFFKTDSKWDVYFPEIANHVERIDIVQQWLHREVEHMEVEPE